MVAAQRAQQRARLRHALPSTSCRLRAATCCLPPARLATTTPPPPVAAAAAAAGPGRRFSSLACWRFWLRPWGTVVGGQLATPTSKERCCWVGSVGLLSLLLRLRRPRPAARRRSCSYDAQTITPPNKQTTTNVRTKKRIYFFIFLLASLHCYRLAAMCAAAGLTPKHTGGRLTAGPSSPTECCQGAAGSTQVRSRPSAQETVLGRALHRVAPARIERRSGTAAHDRLEITRQL